MAGVTRHHWFLPETPDVVGLLRRHLAVTIEGLEAFEAWAAGDEAAASTVRECEHRADEAKREVRAALTVAFITPLEPEDLFTLSRGIDRIINESKDTVRESEVMRCPPDTAVAEMAARLLEAARDLDRALAGLGSDAAGATAAADAAVKARRRLEHVYRTAMAALVEADDLREVTARRELYRRCSRIGEAVVDVAERVEYALLKES